MVTLLAYSYPPYRIPHVTFWNGEKRKRRGINPHKNKHYYITLT